MNDLGYPPMSQDMTKNNVDLYSSEPMSFAQPINNNSKSNTFSPLQDYDQWRNSSDSITINSSSMDTNSMGNNPATNPVSCDLQEVIIYYQSQPELLRLILLSKVEEDKRRSEEAKLRAKELDVFLLQQQQQQFASSSPETPDGTTIMSSTPPLVINTTPLPNDHNHVSLNGCNNTNDTLLNANHFPPTPRKPSALEMLLDEPECNPKGSFDGSANSDEYDDCDFSSNTASAAAASMLSMR